MIAERQLEMCHLDSFKQTRALEARKLREKMEQQEEEAMRAKEKGKGWTIRRT